MPNLFDALQKQQAPQQQQVQDTLAAKSGKALAPGAPKASSLGETQAVEQTQTAGQQLAVQGQAATAEVANQQAQLAQQQGVFQATQAAEQRTAAGTQATQATAVREGLAAREADTTLKLGADESLKTTSIMANASQKLRELASSRRIAVDDIFSDFEHSNKELEFRKDGAQLEQLGFLLAMQDKAYLDEIDQVGRLRGMEDELSYREEMYRLTFGQGLSDLTDQLGFQSKFNADQRAFDRQLASVDEAWAIKLAEAAITDANRQAMVQGVVDTGKAGADAYGKRDGKPAPKQDGVTYKEHAALED